MRITPKNIKKFQMGGEMAPAQEEEMPAEGGEMAPEEGGQDPMLMLGQLAAQALESQDCNAAMQLALMIMEMLLGGGQEQAAPEGQPVFRRGGILVRRIRK